jgi:hypothetical protein
VVLFIVRREATDFSGYLHQTFAGQPIYILWDRRVGERRRERSRFVLDRRRDDRRDAASPLSLGGLPFIAVTARRTAGPSDPAAALTPARDPA